MAFLTGGANSAADTGYDVANSCRFNRGDDPQMSKSLGAPSDADKWTFSAWVKLTDFGTDRYILSLYTDDNNETGINFENGNSINFFNYVSGSYAGRLVPNQLLRDPAAWCHVVAVFDSGNGTAGNRMRLYLNGAEITSFATDANPNQDQDSFNADGVTCVVGRAGTDDYTFGGYMAEVVFCDGQAYAASDFGEFDSDSPTIWKPKDVSGLTFGNNGFYLDFEASANLGNDANGGTDLTEANLAATDQTTDTPTNNFCTINPLDYFPTVPADAEGNTTYNKSSTGDTHNSYASCTLGAAAGKWYFELKVGDANAFHAGMVGMPHAAPDSSGGYSSDSGLYAMNNNGAKTVAGSDTGSATNTVTTNDIVGMAFDLDNGKFYMSKNGTWENSGDPTSGATGTGSLGDITLGEFFVPMIGNRNYNATSLHYFNFGNPSYSLSSAVNDGNGYGNFEYAVPSGYLALCTKNLGSSGG